jgi:bifunctional non-homologous end joining protein LigD
MASSKKAAPRKTSSKSVRQQKLAGAKVPAAEVLSSADLVDEQLARYRSMRDFSVTHEPSGKNKDDNSVKGLPFCVQKHAASHLHYDFRLGWNGVLKSWAVAKGPSYYTGDKRLAVQVEDHPVEYGGFEGVIPKGQYGGGTVMLWDQGTWEPQPEYPDIEAGLRDGSLKFILHGTKLKGKWALIRMKGKWAKESKPNWLLIKEHDSFERGKDDDAVTESESTSAVTGRTLDEIARNEDHVWNSKQTHTSDRAWVRKEETKEDSVDLRSETDALPKEQQAKFVPPQLASIADVPPSSGGWLHELKLDGYRIQARKTGNRVQMLTRTGLDWTARMKSVAQEIKRLSATDVTLDGELVVLAENGTTSFANLQASMQDDAHNALSYFAFDLLHLNGHSTRELRLTDRKDILSKLLAALDSDIVRLSEHIETGGEKLLREACKLRAEGIVSKRADALYKSGRSSDWVKTKCLHEQEFAVGGFTLPANGIHGVGALLLGYYRDGKLIYAGRTGTGFTQKTHKMLRDQLDELQEKTSPFVTVPSDALKGITWVTPKLVAQVRFANWTSDNLVRQSAFLGMREDKGADEVVREDAETSIGPKSQRQRSSATASVSKVSGKAFKREPSDAETAPVRLTHPDKILDRESGMTKRMLADYYWAIAEYMLPEILNRPVSLVRCPDGVGKPSFFQKHVNATLPGSIKGVDVPDKKTGKVEEYITVDSREALVSLAQLGVLELHPWGSLNDDLEHPDRIIFDLDPDESLDWKSVVHAAEEVRALLKEHGLESFVKTTGGKGLHVVAPIEPTLSWNELKELARQMVASLERAAPQRYLTKMSKTARSGKIYLDYLRNERGSTSVSAYSPRARDGAPVSMPLSWRELINSNERPQFRVADFDEWRNRLKQNPWRQISPLKQRIKKKTG